jgi:hypothetical protein
MWKSISSTSLIPDTFSSKKNIPKYRLGLAIDYWDYWKHRKSPVEEFFYLTVLALKFVHPQKDLILPIKAKEIYAKAIKNPNLQFYEYISYIQNFLDKAALRLKYSQPKIKNKKKSIKKVPIVTHFAKPFDYDVIDGFFLNDDSNLSIY